MALWIKSPPKDVKDRERVRLIEKAIAVAAELMAEPAWFVEAMKAHGKLSFTKASPEMVALSMVRFYEMQDIEIRLYSASSSKTLAMFSSRTPYVIFLNRKNLNRSVDSIDGSIWHELAHAADLADGNYRAGHGSNSSKGKARSAPYLAGAIFKTQAKIFLASTT